MGAASYDRRNRARTQRDDGAGRLGFTAWFPWFADACDGISIFTQIVQSGLVACCYKMFAR